jgi:hypothetical protein
MTDLLVILAFLCFAVAAIWNGVLKAYPMMLVCIGLALWVLNAYGPIKIG